MKIGMLLTAYFTVAWRSFSFITSTSLSKGFGFAFKVSHNPRGHNGLGMRSRSWRTGS